VLGLGIGIGLGTGIADLKLTCLKLLAQKRITLAMAAPSYADPNCWLLPEKFTFCLKNSGFVGVWGYSPPTPWLLRLWPK